MPKLKNDLVKGNRSQAEQIVINMLRFHFKNLRILPNDKSAIGKEIDIFLPDFKFAIEIDGITHIKPIFGEATFKRTQESDARKDKALAEAGIKLYRVVLPEKSGDYYTFLKSEVPNRLVVEIKDWISRSNTIL